MSKPKPQFVGVDDGHYSIKVVREDGKCFAIPSRARVGRHIINWQSKADDSGFYETQEGNVYTVSSDLTDPSDTRFSDYPKSELNRVLVYHALNTAELGGQDVVITTGLPINSYYLAEGRRNDALIQAKRANLRRSVSRGEMPVAHIVENLVTTEAISAYFDQLMDIDGNPSKNYDEMMGATVGVIDIGGKTSDSAVVMPGGQQVDTNRSGSSDIGVLRLNDYVKSRLVEKFELDTLPPKFVESAIRHGKVKLFGSDKDVSNLVAAEKLKVVEEVMSTVRHRIGSGADLDFVLFVGGGAVVLEKELKAIYPHGRVVEDPLFANARGMFKIAKYVSGVAEE